MTRVKRILRKDISVMCTVTVRHTDETLEAHVELDDGLLPDAGDSVTVYGGAVAVPYGESITLRRNASLTRGSLLDKLWARIQSLFLFRELYEVSFTDQLTGRRSSPCQ